MPDPETDFPSESSLSADAQFNGAPKRELILDHADGDRLSGADDDDAETSYDPTGIEANRARELGLGVGERDLQRQKDPVVFDSAADDDQLEVLRDDMLTPEDEEGLDTPSGGVQQGGDRTRSAERDEGRGQGPQTTQQNRDQFNGENRA